MVKSSPSTKESTNLDTDRQRGWGTRFEVIFHVEVKSRLERRLISIVSNPYIVRVGVNNYFSKIIQPVGLKFCIMYNKDIHAKKV